MRGAKPKLKNVIPMRPDGSVADEDLREQNIQRAIRALQPHGIGPELIREWKRVARILAEPSVDRLKARYLDAIIEYCRVCVRLRHFREAMPTLQQEIYNAAVIDDGETVKPTRNGIQIKTHPYVAQMNEAWRQWRSLVAMLGLSPTDERNLIPGQGDMFDDADHYFR
jgi:P27 family predicted phage terminase small subunit